MSVDNQPKRGRGRAALPEDIRQSGLIRERVKPGIEDAYMRLGGKLFLCEVIQDRMRDYQPGRRVKATFVPQAWVDDCTVNVDPQGDTVFDVTHIVLAMGKQKALAIRDCADSSDDLRDSETAPKWVRDWTGPFAVFVEDSIKTYFLEA